MSGDRVAGLVPDDEELVDFYRQAEHVLHFLASAEDDSAGDDQPWRLPAPLAGRQALDALGRIGEELGRLLDAFRSPTRWGSTPAVEERGPRLFGPDDRYEHMPLRVAELDPADLDTLAATVGVVNLALSPAATAAVGDPAQRLRVGDLASLLEMMEPDPDLWPPAQTPASAADLLRPLARLVAVLDLSPDDDTALLVDLLHTAAGDVVLTAEQEAAYQRVVSRLNLLTSNADPLHRFLY